MILRLRCGVESSKTRTGCVQKCPCLPLSKLSFPMEVALLLEKETTE